MGGMKTARLFGSLAALALLAAGSPVMNSQAAPAAARTPGAAPQLVILDTDIGDDIDDAFALALVLRSPELELLGVTTAFGDTELRARLVERYVKAVGRIDISVGAGVRTADTTHFTEMAYSKQEPGSLADICATRLLMTQQLPVPKRVQAQYDACEKDRHDGAGFLLSQIRAHPGQITLI